MGNKLDCTGKRYGNLIAIRECGRAKDNAILWLCICDCGNHHLARGTYLNRGIITSCGCMKGKKKVATMGTHGMSYSRIYGIWKGVKRRCKSPKFRGYENYGGRGIKVCKEWLGEEGFNNFHKWAIENGYQENLTIDRIDVNGDYEPDNCRWITNAEQQYNKRTTYYLTYKDEKKNLKEWAQITGIGASTIRSRVYDYGWSVEKALETPVNTKYRHKEN